jgi:hypothetical protein
MIKDKRVANPLLTTKEISMYSRHDSIDHSTHRLRRMSSVLVLLLFVACGCGGKHISTGSKAVLPTGKVRLAILPLENLTKHHNAGMIGAELLISEVHSRGRFDIVPLAEVREVMEQLDISRADRMKNITAEKIGKAVTADLVPPSPSPQAATMRASAERTATSRALLFLNMDSFLQLKSTGHTGPVGRNFRPPSVGKHLRRTQNWTLHLPLTNGRGHPSPSRWSRF